MHSHDKKRKLRTSYILFQLKEREEQARKEREREERKQAEMERAREDDKFSTGTEQFSAPGNSNASESGFSSGHSHSTATQPRKGADILIDIPGKSDESEQEKEEKTEEKKKKEKRRKEGLGNHP